MKKLPAYILFKYEDGTEGILQTSFPHYKWFVSYTDNLSTTNVAGYRITLVFAGSFHGNHIIYAHKMKEQLQAELDKVASWYLSEVIGKDLEKFQRYAL